MTFGVARRSLASLAFVMIGICFSSAAYAAQSPSQLLRGLAEGNARLDVEMVDQLSSRVSEIIERNGSEPWNAVSGNRREAIRLAMSELLQAISRDDSSSSSGIEIELANFEIAVIQFLQCPLFDTAQVETVMRQSMQIVDALISSGEALPVFEGSQVLYILRGKLEARFRALPNSPFSPAYKVPLSTEELQSLCSFSSDTLRSSEITNDLVPGWEQMSPAERVLFLQENADMMASRFLVQLTPIFARYAELSVLRAEQALGVGSTCAAMTTAEVLALQDRVAQGYEARSKAEQESAEQQGLAEASRAAALATMVDSLVNE